MRTRPQSDENWDRMDGSGIPRTTLNQGASSIQLCIECSIDHVRSLSSIFNLTSARRHPSSRCDEITRVYSFSQH